MSKFSRLQVYQSMMDQGMVPLFYHSDIEVSEKIVDAIYAGGARTLEFTNRGDLAYEVFAYLSKKSLSKWPDLKLGIGSISDAPTAALYIQLGCDFIVSASLREDVALICNRKKIPYMPGCGTLTEIGKAEELGCEIIKLFPASIYGPKFISSIKGPSPWTLIMPTGGVSPQRENLESWFNAGACCVGMGSALISKKIIETGNYNSLATKTQETLELIKQIRDK